MNCSAQHQCRSAQRPLATALLLAVVYMLAEACGAWWSGSLALWADAGHMLSDAAALALSLLAAWIAHRPGSPQQTFGYARAEIFAATANGVLLLWVALGIGWEAWQRWSGPTEIRVGAMALIGFGGLLVNLAMLRLLHGGHSHNLNVRGAWLHVLGDLLGSCGVLIAAACLPLGWWWADPLASLLIAGLIVVSAWRLLADAVGVLMEQSPAAVDVSEVRRVLTAGGGVADVHCLHVWSLTGGLHLISAHVVMQPGHDAAAALARLRSDLQRAFCVEHVTLQVEPADFRDCDEASGVGCRPATAGAMKLN